MKLGQLVDRRGDLILFLEAVWWLFFASLTIRLLPFKTLAKLLTPRVAGKTIDGELRCKCLQKVRWAVIAASRRVSWRAVCFHRGIAVQRMLCRRGIAAQLHYGVGNGETGLAAHVWVSAGDVIVVGGETAEGFVEITVFPPR